MRGCCNQTSSNPWLSNLSVRQFSVTVRTTFSGAPDGISASISSETFTALAASNAGYRCLLAIGTAKAIRWTMEREESFVFYPANITTHGRGRPLHPLSTGHVEDCICTFFIAPQFLNGGCRGDDEQFDLATLRLALYFRHYRQLPVGSGTDHQPAALPWNVLLWRQRSMSKVVTEFLGRFFLALANLSAFDDYVVLVSGTVDTD